MKNNALILFLLILISYGCESEYETYNGKDVVFMNETTDTTKFSFTYIDGQFLTQTKDIKVMTIGKTYDYDRKVGVKFSFKNAVEGVDFEPFEKDYIIKAGEVSFVIPVVMKRSADLQVNEKFIDIELVENENFSLDYDYGSSVDITWVKTQRVKHTVVFSEFMNQKPTNVWDPYMFGDFSPKKFFLTCDVMEISRSQFVDNAYMTSYRMMFVSKSMQEYLNAEKAAGRTVYEADNVTEMKMGKYAN